jgi:threonine/homoserine/homoserine lactone efflux protein
MVGVLNPKTLVFFAAILPQFVDRPKGHLVSQLLLLGTIFCLIALISDGTWGFIAATIRGWLSSTPQRLERLRLGGGVVMVGLGIFTFINSVLHA